MTTAPRSARVTTRDRIAWVLRVNRTQNLSPAWRRGTTFADAFHGGSWPRPVNAVQITRWETGKTRPPRGAVARYEELLDLDPGEITSTIDTIGRYLQPFDTRGSNAVWPPHQRSGGPFEGEFDELFAKVTSNALLSGADWDRLTALAVADGVYVMPAAARDAIAQRLVSEMIIAHGRPWRQRFEALNRLLGHRLLGPQAIGACGALAADPGNQVFIEIVSALDGTAHPDASRHVIGQLHAP